MRSQKALAGTSPAGAMTEATLNIGWLTPAGWCPYFPIGITVTHFFVREMSNAASIQEPAIFFPCNI